MPITFKLLADEIPESGVEILAYNPDRKTHKLTEVFHFSSSFAPDKIKQVLSNSNYTQWTYIFEKN